MFKFLMLLMLFACAPQQENKPHVTTLSEQVHDKGEFYRSQIPSDDKLFPERCDKLTFKSYLSAVGPRQDMSGFEKNGRYERDLIACYPDSSKATISRDAILAVLHDIWSYKDIDRLNRLISYGESKNWVIGDGPLDYTNMALLLPIIYRMHNKLEGTELNISTDLAGLDEVLSGFQGHLLAGYLWLKARMEKELNQLEMQTLERLYKANEEDPMYSALYHRFGDGDQTKTHNILLGAQEFPDDRVSLETGVFGWGSEPSLVAYLVSLSIAEGN
jgi:hypothetical protein